MATDSEFLLQATLKENNLSDKALTAMKVDFPFL